MNKIFPAVFPLFVACQTAQEPPQCEPTEVVRVVEKIVPAACEPDQDPEPAVPDGFPAEDEFELIIPACRVMTARLTCKHVVKPGTGTDKCRDKVREQNRAAITQHCRVRARFAGQEKCPVSKIGDGTCIHDRDRVAGDKMYWASIVRNWLIPDACPWHVIDRKVGHTAIEHEWVANWPFTSTPVDGNTLADWMSTDHDTERFVARGPIDNVPAYGWQYLPDRCFDPAQFDRNDVSVWAHTMRALTICARAAAEQTTCTYGFLRCNWGHKGRRRCAEKAREAASA